VARLADFGVAKAASRTVRTKTGLVKGKVAYMSPEQARGHKVDRRCDVWAAGVVVWELITGRKLYDHEDDVATLLSVVTEEPPRLGTVMQGVPPALDDAIAYALTSDVTNRCPSAETFRCMLESAWDECGGMATTAELGAFVRQTVGQKLAERRTLTARGRPSQPPSAPGESGNPGLGLPRSNATARAPEDGTKTAISAAVPAAERVGTLHSAPVWRRSVSIAVMLSASVVAAGVMGLAVTSPRGGTPSKVDPRAGGATNPTPSPPVLVPAPPPEPVRSPATDDDSTLDAPDAREGITVSEPETDAVTHKNTAESGTAPGTGRSARRGGAARSKTASHKGRPKATPRSGAGRASKAVALPTRVLPIPQPSERQQRYKAEAATDPPPLNLAPDPYDSTR
jgi:eukaryotic-like serine/threonine-protein kinase